MAEQAGETFASTLDRLREARGLQHSEGRVTACAQCSDPLPPLPIDVRGLDPWSGEYRTKKACSKACARMLKAAGEEAGSVDDAPNVEVEVSFREELPA